MFDDLYPEESQAAFEAKLARPPGPTEPTQRFSMWGISAALPKGLAAGAAQGIASTADVLGAFGSILGATPASGRGMFSPQTEEEAKQTKEASDKLIALGPDFRTGAGENFRNVAKDYTPDPLTAHASERVVFDIARMGGKAITAAVTLGNIPGAVLAGLEEGFTQSDELASQGVDLATRTKVGAVTAATNAASFALPVAGKTVAKTVALALAGGPVSLIAQNAATREILQNADYSKLADQYDPFDPVGLALSTVIPLGFGALALRGARVKAARNINTVDAADNAIKTQVTDDVVDAARVSLLRQNIDSTNPLPDDLATAKPHSEAHSTAIEQMAIGERVNVVDLLPESMALKVTNDMRVRLEPLRIATEQDAQLRAQNEIEPVPIGKVEADAIADVAQKVDQAPDATTTAVETTFHEREATSLAIARPEIEVQVEGMAERGPIADVIARIKQDLDADLKDVDLLRVAAECFLT